MKIILLWFVFLLPGFNTKQNHPEVYLVTEKGIYVTVHNKNKKVKVPYKENNDFYFFIKNDTIAVIQEISHNKLSKAKEFRISTNYDTVYVKRHTLVKGKEKQIVEKVIYRKVY